MATCRAGDSAYPAKRNFALQITGGRNWPTPARYLPGHAHSFHPAKPSLVGISRLHNRGRNPGQIFAPRGRFGSLGIESGCEPSEPFASVRNIQPAVYRVAISTRRQIIAAVVDSRSHRDAKPLRNASQRSWATYTLCLLSGKLSLRRLRARSFCSVRPPPPGALLLVGSSSVRAI